MLEVRENETVNNEKMKGMSGGTAAAAAAAAAAAVVVVAAAVADDHYLADGHRKWVR